jgi:hypothetical protein
LFYDKIPFAMPHSLYCIIAGLIVLASLIGLLAGFSKRKDPTETDEGKIIPFGDPEDITNEENPLSWKDSQAN